MTSLCYARDLLPRIYGHRLLIRGVGGASSSLLVVHKLINGKATVVDAKKSTYMKEVYYI
jgi:hypothetical protein